jgi:Xaa-Pro aminopeptidase
MNRKEFAKRRRQLMRMVGKGAIAILPASQIKMRNRDVEYNYRQDSDFYYLTGFPEPEAVAVLAPGRPGGEYILFCREKDPQREIWDGRRVGPNGAVDEFDADDAFPISDIDEILPGIIENCERVYYSIGIHPEFDQRLIGWVSDLRGRGGRSHHTPDEFITLDHLLHDQRLYKSRAEISTMRRAAKLAARAHKRAMGVCRPGMHEFELEAEFQHEFRRNSTQMAYQPIVGSGPNACVLHYVDNDRQMMDGDLVLVDIGCEHDYYASDVTRTFPVNGRFSDAQRTIYDIVLEAHQAALDNIAPGRHWNEPHDAAVKVITKGLRRIGLLKGQLTTLISKQAYQPYFMHRTGHWLGLDVHDVGDYKVSDQWRLLEPGMVMTVEPGIYIADRARGVAKRWWGIGVRIEDDILVTRDGNEVLTGDLPRQPDDVEALVGAALG